MRGPRQAPDLDAINFPCPQCNARVEAAQIIADSNSAIATAIHEAVRELRPLVKASSELLIRVNLLCSFMCKWTIPLLLFLVMSGVMTPDMIRGFHNLLKVFGAG